MVEICYLDEDLVGAQIFSIISENGNTFFATYGC